MAISRKQFLIDEQAFSIPGIKGVFKVNAVKGYLMKLQSDDSWMQFSDIRMISASHFETKLKVFEVNQLIKISFSCLNPESTSPVKE